MSEDSLEELFMWSNGVSETPSGLVAVNMLTYSARDNDNFYFRFLPSYRSKTVTVEWPVDNDFALLPAQLAEALMAKSYAAPISEAQLEAYNSQFVNDAAQAPRAAAKGKAARQAATPTDATELPPQAPPSAPAAPTVAAVDPAPNTAAVPVLDLTKPAVKT